MRRGDSNVKGRGLALWRKVWVCKAVDQSPGFASTVSASGRKEFFRSHQWVHEFRAHGPKTPKREIAILPNM
jgi:hypothetical protein